MTDEDDLDYLYEDLELKETQGERELRVENERLRQENDSLQSRLSVLQERHNERLRENEVLSRNLSSLIKTARLEVNRKNASITELKKKVDDLVFKRSDAGSAAVVIDPKDIAPKLPIPHKMKPYKKGDLDCCPPVTDLFLDASKGFHRITCGNSSVTFTRHESLPCENQNRDIVYLRLDDGSFLGKKALPSANGKRLIMTPQEYKAAYKRKHPGEGENQPQTKKDRNEPPHKRQEEKSRHDRRPLDAAEDRRSDRRSHRRGDKYSERPISSHRDSSRREWSKDRVESRSHERHDRRLPPRSRDMRDPGSKKSSSSCERKESKACDEVKSKSASNECRRKRNPSPKSKFPMKDNSEKRSALNTAKSPPNNIKKPTIKKDDQKSINDKKSSPPTLANPDNITRKTDKSERPVNVESPPPTLETMICEVKQEDNTCSKDSPLETMICEEKQEESHEDKTCSKDSPLETMISKVKQEDDHNACSISSASSQGVIRQMKEETTNGDPSTNLLYSSRRKRNEGANMNPLTDSQRSNTNVVSKENHHISHSQELAKKDSPETQLTETCHPSRDMLIKEEPVISSSNSLSLQQALVEVLHLSFNEDKENVSEVPTKLSETNVESSLLDDLELSDDSDDESTLGTLFHSEDKSIPSSKVESPEVKQQHSSSKKTIQPPETDLSSKKMSRRKLNALLFDDSEDEEPSTNGAPLKAPQDIKSETSSLPNLDRLLSPESTAGNSFSTTLDINSSSQEEYLFRSAGIFDTPKVSSSSPTLKRINTEELENLIISRDDLVNQLIEEKKLCKEKLSKVYLISPVKYYKEDNSSKEPGEISDSEGEESPTPSYSKAMSQASMATPKSASVNFSSTAGIASILRDELVRTAHVSPSSGIISTPPSGALNSTRKRKQFVSESTPVRRSPRKHPRSIHPSVYSGSKKSPEEKKSSAITKTSRYLFGDDNEGRSDNSKCPTKLRSRTGKNRR